MKTNLTLIGMPGAGKSTIGIILAKNLSLGFVDTDVLIQTRQGISLQQILDTSGHLQLRAIEEAEILRLDVTRHVIATGGSAAYSEAAMAHLRRISTIIFLEVSFEEIERRIKNFSTRGIAKSPHQTFQALFEERQQLYHRHAEWSIPCNGASQEEIAHKIADHFLSC